MPPYATSVLTGMCTMVVRVSSTFTLVTYGLGGVATDAIAAYDASGAIGGGRRRFYTDDCYAATEFGPSDLWQRCRETRAGSHSMRRWPQGPKPRLSGTHSR